VLDEPPALVWYAIVYCDAYCLCMCSAAFVCCITLFCPFACFFLWSSMLNSGWVTPVLGPDSGACPDWASDIHGSVVLVAAAMYIATRVNQSINQPPVLGPDSGACPDWASDIHGSVVLVAAAMYIATRVNQSINQSDATNVYCHSCKSINQSKGCHKLDLAMYISTYVISSWMPNIQGSMVLSRILHTNAYYAYYKPTAIEVQTNRKTTTY
jgi:hypothetical protein